MRGNQRRSSTRSRATGGRPVAALVVVLIAALCAACAPSPAPTPSPVAVASGGPGVSSAPAGSPGASSAAVPGTTPEPGDASWASGVIIPPAQPVATFEATEASVAGVLVNTAFRLTPLDGSDPLTLANRLTADPPVDLVAAASGGSALVTPVRPLDEGRQYRFALTAPDGTIQGTWAVQAVGPLGVAATTPGDGSTRVPVDTGIELTFNQLGVTTADLERHLTIEPATEGRLEQAGRTIAFVPESPLRKATLYTVTLRHGLPLAGTPMTLEEDVVVRFETAGGTPSGVHLAPLSRLWETRPTEQATIPLNLERWWPDEEGEGPAIPMPQKVDVTVHRLADMDAAITAWRRIGRAPSWTLYDGAAPVPTDGLRTALDASLTLRSFDPEVDWQVYVRLPHALPAGWYVVTISFEDVPQQLVLQVTDLALYTVVTTTRSLAWVNDLATRGPVAGATATIAGKPLGTTNRAGLAVGATPGSLVDAAESAAAGPGLVITASKDGRAVFLPAGQGDCDKICGETESSAWWVAFGPDRYQYRPTDTINAWGTLHDRGTGKVPGGVDVVLSTWSDTTALSTRIAAEHATPDANGAFMTSLKVSDLPYGDYRLELLVGDTVVAERGISVTAIEKPAWTLTLGTSRHAVIHGATVRVTADASFFEGTPVAGAGVTLDAQGTDVPLTTGVDGTGSGTARLTIDPGSGSQWELAEIAGRPTLPEEGEITDTTLVAVFSASVIVRSSAIVDGSRLVVSGTVHDVAFASFERGDDADSVDPYGALRPGATVIVAAVEEIPVRTKVGTEYDFITKRVVPVYEYDTRTVTLATKTVVTDAKGRFRVTYPVTGANRSYTATIRTTDAAGRTTTEEAYAANNAVSRTSDVPDLDGWYREDGWSVGERVRVSFMGGHGAGEAATYLWTTARAGLRSWAVTTKPRWSTTFRAADVPGFSLNAVRFNGRAYEVASSEAEIRFRMTDRAMTVAVTPGQARYTPGGRATLDIRTTGPDGQPVAASVYVNVVDEKLVAMGLVETSSPLDALYQAEGSGVLRIGWTHRDPSPEGGEGGGDTTGGGGDDAGRADFRDWLVATIVRTGADGRASLSFDLSDDLTSWHAFASGVTGSLLAGQGEAKLPVSLPFFAELTVAETYLAADQPIVAVRAYGGGLAASDTVTFTIFSDTLPMAPVIIRAKAFTPAEVPLPALSVGTHRLRIEATGSGTAQHDVLTRTFTVITSRAAQASVVSAPLAAKVAVAGGSGFTTLLLGDAGRGRVIPALTELAEGSLVRGDRALAAAVAARLLRDSFGIPPTSAALDVNLHAFQPGDGFAVLPYSSAGLELSALAAMADNPGITGLDDYFAGVVPTTREEQLWVVVGRAATGAPVATEIASFGDLPSGSLDERVALALAATAAGDEALAGRLLEDILRTSGERQGPWVRVASREGEDASIVLTARLAIVAAWLGRPVAAEMDAYLATHHAKTTVVDLERALAAQGWVRRVPASDAVAALTVDGRRSEVRIDGSQPATVVLTPVQAAGATLEPVSGSVIVTTLTERPLDPASFTPPAGQTISRTVSPKGSVTETDAVVVSLRVHLAATDENGCWMVTELVPSGLVPVTRGGWSSADDEEEESTTGTEGPWRVTGQRVDFCVTVDPDIRIVTLRYVARVVTPGTYRWEETLLQWALDPGVGTVLPASSITIAGRQ